MSKPMLPFPLQYPAGHRRTPAEHRRRSQFGADHAGAVSLADARVFVLDELARLGAVDVVITSNIPTSRDDLARTPGAADPGVAVWFVRDGEQHAIACDQWLTIAENLRAVGLTIEAMRGLDRWGCSEAVTTALSGFAALPAGSTDARPATAVAPVAPRAVAPRTSADPAKVNTAIPTIADWRTVLRAEPGDDLATVKAKYRKLMRVCHSDVGGRDSLAAKLNAAMAQAEAELAPQRAVP